MSYPFKTLPYHVNKSFLQQRKQLLYGTIISVLSSWKFYKCSSSQCARVRGWISLQVPQNLQIAKPEALASDKQVVSEDIMAFTASLAERKSSYRFCLIFPKSVIKQPS